MKKLLFVTAIASLFISAIAFSSPSLVKSHKGKAKDGVQVNCAYCHQTAGIGKTEKDYPKFQKGKFCAGSGCH